MSVLELFSLYGTIWNVPSGAYFGDQMPRYSFAEVGAKPPKL